MVRNLGRFAREAENKRGHQGDKEKTSKSSLGRPDTELEVKVRSSLRQAAAVLDREELPAGLASSLLRLLEIVPRTGICMSNLTSLNFVARPD